MIPRMSRVIAPTIGDQSDGKPLQEVEVVARQQQRLQWIRAEQARITEIQKGEAVSFHKPIIHPRFSFEVVGPFLTAEILIAVRAKGPKIDLTLLEGEREFAVRLEMIHLQGISFADDNGVTKGYVSFFCQVLDAPNRKTLGSVVVLDVHSTHSRIGEKYRAETRESRTLISELHLGHATPPADPDEHW